MNVCVQHAVSRYATGNDGCLFWAEAYGDDIGYLLAFREVVALLVRYVLLYTSFLSVFLYETQKAIAR